MQTGKPRRTWLPPVAGLIGGAIAFLVIVLTGFDLIGAAGVGVIAFVITWLNVRKYYR